MEARQDTDAGAGNPKEIAPEKAYRNISKLEAKLAKAVAANLDELKLKVTASPVEVFGRGEGGLLDLD
jgi:hypothetical protein